MLLLPLTLDRNLPLTLGRRPAVIRVGVGIDCLGAPPFVALGLKNRESESVLLCLGFLITLKKWIIELKATYR